MGHPDQCWRLHFLPGLSSIPAWDCLAFERSLRGLFPGIDGGNVWIPLLLFILSPFLPAVLPDTSLRLTFSTWLSQHVMGVMSSFGQILGAWLTLFGMLLVFVGWKMIHQSKGLVTTGIYRFIRHPQYTGIFLILTGWVIHWPTLPTLLMYPILLFAYARLARKEENDMIAEFGEAYLRYRDSTPGFFPVVFRR